MTADTLRRTFVVRDDKADDTTGPVCLEHDKRLCGRPATHECFIEGLSTSWGALCERCQRYYASEYVRVLTTKRRDLHELAQWRDGTIWRRFPVGGEP